jgi:hypothetical protein
MNRGEEILEELKTVLSGRNSWLDSLIPPTIFIILNSWQGLIFGVVGAVVSVGLIALFRLFRRQPLRYALAGLAGVLAAGAVAQFLGRAEGYFLPGIATGLLTAALCLISVLVKRPLVAWTSHLTRRWPLAWYWHPRVRPAYSEVTLVWMIFFLARVFSQYYLFQQGAADALGIVQVLTGWPALIVLLVISYLFGLWRLRSLNGPSVEEFVNQKEPPWQGQNRGF